MATKTFGGTVYTFDVTYSYNGTTFKITKVVSHCNQSGWATWDLTPDFFMYIVNGNNSIPSSYQKADSASDITGWIKESPKYGVYENYNGNDPTELLSNSKGGSVTWSSDKLNSLSLNPRGSTVTIGTIIRNTTGSLNGIAFGSIYIDDLYKPPSGLSLSISEVGTTSFKVTAKWTGGVASDGRAYVRIGSGAEKLIDNDPVYFTGLTPNVSYTVTGRLADDVNPNASYDTASVSETTDPVAPHGWTNTGNNTNSIWATATSSNGGNFKYQYRIYKDGYWSGWQDSNSFGGLASNINYSIQAKTVSTSTWREAGTLDGSLWTDPTAPHGWTNTGSNTNSVWATAVSNTSGSFKYQYQIYKNGAWSGWQDSPTFGGLASNTRYPLHAKTVSTSTWREAGTLSGELWTYPVVGWLNVELVSGQEHDAINATAGIEVSSGNDSYQFRIDGNYTGWQRVGKTWTGLTGHQTYTIGVKVKNDTTGYQSAEITKQITTWYDPIYSLSINMVNRWFWYLEVDSTFNYQGGPGNITKYEFDIGGQGWQNKGKTNSHSRGSINPTGAGKLNYNTDYVCKVRLTDNHGRTKEASATFKTLDERPLYVNGVLREVKVIKSDNSVEYVTPNLLSVVKSDGTVVNMNKIINNDNRTEYN